MASPIDRQDGVLVFGNNDGLPVPQSPKKGLIQKVARFFGLGRAPSAEPTVGLELYKSPWDARRITQNPIYREDPVIDKDDSGLEIKKESPIEQFEVVITAGSAKGSPSDLLGEKQLTPSSQNSKSPALSEEPLGETVFTPIQSASLKSTSGKEGSYGSMVVNSIQSECLEKASAFMRNHNFEDNFGKWNQYLAGEPIYITRANLDPQTEELYAVLPCDRGDYQEIVIDNSSTENVICSVKESEKTSMDSTFYPISPGFVAERINRYSPK